MRTTRVYIDQEIDTAKDLELTGQVNHYLLNVLRLKTASKVTLFNGNGHEYSAELVDVSRKRTRLQILGRSEQEALPRLNIHLGIGLSKGDRFDWAIQKATELGVSSITPLITEFSTLKISSDRLEKKHHHWLGIMQSACEQSGRCYLPEIKLPETLIDWINHSSNALKLVLNPHQGQSLHSQTCDKDLTILVGPEGGLSEKEIKSANDHDFISIKLGNLVLRTETAPVAAIAAAQTLWGSFKN